jgi:gliding motility-associated-like protein
VNGGTPNYTYAWSPTGGNADNAQNLSAGSYDVLITDNNNCTLTQNIVVTEPTQVSATVTPTDVSCYGYTDGQLNVSASGGTPGYSFGLSNGDQNNIGQFTGLATGNYSITIADANNCSISEQSTIGEPDSVTIIITPTPVTVNLGDEVTLQTATNQSGPLTYSWGPPNGLNCYDCAAPVFSGNYSLNYVVTVTNATGCTGTYAAEVTVIPNYEIFVPNAFSPNGDGANDDWMIYGNLQGIKQLNVAVFNRIGEKVFETTDLNFKWDGRYKGTYAPPGVYVYVAQFVWLNNHTDSSYKGTVTVVK